MSRLRGRALLVSALFTAWACAKATDSDLGGSEVDSNAAKGGGAGHGGTVAKGGSGGSSAASTGGTSTGGKGGTGTGGSSTGGSATGGSSTGGSGNASGSGGSGGNAGDDGVPPDVLARAKVVLRHIARNSSDHSNAVEAQLFFENRLDDPLDLSDVKVRYWTTLEVSWERLACYHFALADKSNVTLKYVEDGDDSHVEIGFKTGTVPAHNASPFTSTEFQMKVDADGGTFDQSNDWSFDALTTDNPPQPNDKITVYLADKLIWGCEPSNICAGEGGAGGQGGQGGEAGQPGTGGSGQGGSVSAGQGGEPTSGQGGA